ncbi:MAG: TRAP transporter small permease [Deltaproteobacteria bacterium]|nr:TRAP transporter small permease [Deltaproteobacteria bacterium]
MFGKALYVLDSIVQKLTHIFVVIAGCLTIFMIFTTVYGVGARYLFRRPEPISYELGTICLLWGFLFAVSSVERDNDHIRAEIFIQFAPEGVRKFLYSFISPFLALFYGLVLTWKGWEVAMYSFSIGETSLSVWGEPLGPVKIMIPICYGLLTLAILSNLLHGIISYFDRGKGAEKMQSSLPF